MRKLSAVLLFFYTVRKSLPLHFSFLHRQMQCCTNLLLCSSASLKSWKPPESHLLVPFTLFGLFYFLDSMPAGLMGGAERCAARVWGSVSLFIVCRKVGMSHSGMHATWKKQAEGCWPIGKIVSTVFEGVIWVMFDRSHQKRDENCEVSREVRMFEWGDREGGSLGLMLKLRSRVSVSRGCKAVATTADICWRVSTWWIVYNSCTTRLLGIPEWAIKKGNLR